MENPAAMGASSISTTRSIAVGLLLAMVSASSLVMFSYVAGSANDPRPSYVQALSPNGSVAPVVLGTSVADAGDERARDGGIRPDGPPSVPVVLGTRIGEDDTEKKPEPGSKEPSEPGKLGPPKDTDDDPSFRRRPSSDDETNGKKKHSPNGHAYGYHRTRTGDDQPGSVGSDPDGGGSNGRGGRAAKTEPPGHANDRGRGHSNGHGKPKH